MKRLNSTTVYKSSKNVTTISTNSLEVKGRMSEDKMYVNSIRLEKHHD